MRHDYIPTSEEALLPFAKTLYAYALANYASWNAVSPQVMLDGLITAYEAAYNTYKAPNHGKIDTLAKNDAKDAMVHALRVYVQAYIARNPAVTGEDKEAMGLPPRDTTPTHHPAPDARPDTDAEPLGKGAHRVSAVNPETLTKEKPERVSGVAYARHVRRQDEPKLLAEDMPSDYKAVAVRVYKYAEADYGKVADYATAYENAAGERGPWSAVVSLIISG